MPTKYSEFKLKLPLNPNGGDTTTPARKAFIDLHKTQKDELAPGTDDDKTFKASNIKRKPRLADPPSTNESFQEYDPEAVKGAIDSHRARAEDIAKKADKKGIAKHVSGHLDRAHRQLDAAHTQVNLGRHGLASDLAHNAGQDIDRAHHIVKKGALYREETEVNEGDVVQFRAKSRIKAGTAPKLGGVTDKDRLLPPEPKRKPISKTVRSFIGKRIQNFGKKVAGEETQVDEKLTHADRSAIVKKAEKGEHVFGGHFHDVEKNAEKEYHSKKIAQKVAAAAMWKKAAKEEVEQTDEANSNATLKVKAFGHAELYKKHGDKAFKDYDDKGILNKKELHKSNRHMQALDVAAKMYKQRTGKTLADEATQVDEKNSTHTLKVKYQYHDKKEIEHGRNWVNHPKDEKEMRKSDLHGKARDIAAKMYKQKTGKTVDEAHTPEQLKDRAKYHDKEMHNSRLKAQGAGYHVQKKEERKTDLHFKAWHAANIAHIKKTGTTLSGEPVDEDVHIHVGGEEKKKSEGSKSSSSKSSSATKKKEGERTITGFEKAKILHKIMSFINTIKGKKISKSGKIGEATAQYNSPDEAKKAGAEWYQASLKEEDPVKSKHLRYLAQMAYTQSAALRKTVQGIG